MYRIDQSRWPRPSRLGGKLPTVCHPHLLPSPLPPTRRPPAPSPPLSPLSTRCRPAAALASPFRRLRSSPHVTFPPIIPPPMSRQRLGSKASSSASELKEVAGLRLGHTLGKGSFGRVRLGTPLQPSTSSSSSLAAPASGSTTGDVPPSALRAVKIIDKSKITDAAVLSAIEREVEIMKRLNHPSIIRYEGEGGGGGWVWKKKTRCHAAACFWKRQSPRIASLRRVDVRVRNGCGTSESVD